MEKTTVVFIDDDRNYLDALFAYLRGSIFRDRILLKAYTSFDAYTADMLGMNSRFHMVVGAARIRHQLSTNGANALFVQLDDAAEDIGFGEAVSEMYADSAAVPRGIDKFQPLQQLFSELFTIRIAHADVPMERMQVRNDTSRAHILAVYSATGGSGKTTVAANIAKQLSFLGKRTFYLNLERLSSAPMFPADGDDVSYARLLYHVKASAGSAWTKLGGLIRIDGESKVEYVPPLIHAEEMEELTVADTERMLAAIAESGGYRFIVLDLDAGQHPRTMAALSQSDTVIWLLLDELQSWTKTKRQLDCFERFHSAYGWRTRTKFLINKFTGSMLHDPLAIGLTIDGYLPYIPAWKTVQHIERLYESPIFTEALRQAVCRNLEEGGGTVGR